MLKSDRTITDYAQRRRVLGRRADIRLARSLRRSVPLRQKLRQTVLRGLKSRARLIRPRLIRHWQNGGFVETTVARSHVA